MSAAEIRSGSSGLIVALLSWFRGVADAIFAGPSHHIVLRLTLLVLILQGSSGIWLDVLLVVLCGTLLVFPALLESRILWLAVCGCVWWHNALDWFWIDNHKFLMSYWCLACALAVQTARPAKVLCQNATLLIGLTFLFALIWKLASGEYTDGSFFYFSLLTDGRMEAIGKLFSDAPPALYATATALVDALESVPADGATVTLPEHAGLRAVAQFGSWATLAIEAAIAVAFLLRALPARITCLPLFADLILIGFIGTAYVFIPVIGFGYILAVMGLATTPDHRRKTRTLYLLLFALLQVGQLPWDAFLN